MSRREGGKDPCRNYSYIMPDYSVPHIRTPSVWPIGRPFLSKRAPIRRMGSPKAALLEDGAAMPLGGDGPRPKGLASRRSGSEGEQLPLCLAEFPVAALSSVSVLAVNQGKVTPKMRRGETETRPGIRTRRCRYFFRLRRMRSATAFILSGTSARAIPMRYTCVRIGFGNRRTCAISALNSLFQASASVASGFLFSMNTRASSLIRSHLLAFTHSGCASRKSDHLFITAHHFWGVALSQGDT